MSLLPPIKYGDIPFNYLNIKCIFSKRTLGTDLGTPEIGSNGLNIIKNEGVKKVDVDYTGYIEDEIITDIVEKVLRKFGIQENKKKISKQILEELEDFFIESSCCF